MRIGDRVRDRINGFTGIITGRTEYLNGCRQFLVKPEKLKKDTETPADGVWLDEQNLEIVDEQVLTEPFVAGSPALAGGPDRRERAT